MGPNNIGRSFLDAFGPNSSGLTASELLDSIWQGIEQGVQNIQDSVGYTLGPKAGFGVETEAFGTKVSLLNFSAGQTTTKHSVLNN